MMRLNTCGSVKYVSLTSLRMAKKGHLGTVDLEAIKPAATVKITTTLLAASKEYIDKYGVQYSDIIKLGITRFKEIVAKVEHDIGESAPIVVDGFSGDGLSSILSRLLCYFSNGSITKVSLDRDGNIIGADFKDDFTKQGDELRLMKSGAKFSTLLSVLSRSKLIHVDDESSKPDVDAQELKDVGGGNEE